MSGRRFLVGLKGETIFKNQRLVKESIDIKDDIKVTENEDAIQKKTFS